MKNRSRLLFYFLLVFTTFSMYGAKSLSYDEAKLRAGVLVVRTTDYYIVCNGVLDSKQTVRSNLHCTYGEHQFVGSDQVLEKLSNDYVEDAIFVINMNKIKIPEDDSEYENLRSLRSNVVRIKGRDIRRLRKGEVTINKDLAEFRLGRKMFYNRKYLEDIAIKSPASGKLTLFGYVENNGYMVRIEEDIHTKASSYGGYTYNMNRENTHKLSGAPLYYEKDGKYSLSGVHNGSNGRKKHAVKLRGDET